MRHTLEKSGICILDSLRQFLHLGDIKISMGFLFFSFFSLQNNPTCSYFVGKSRKEEKKSLSMK